MGKTTALNAKILALLLVGLLVLGGIAALSLTTPQQAYAKTKIALTKSKATVLLGKSLALKLDGAKASKVKWSSSKKSVATVKSGKVTTKKAGTTTITATYKGKKYKCKVTVAKLVISKIGTLYSVGKKYLGSYESVVVKCYKHGTKCPDVKLSSSNKKVAVVDAYGYIEARGKGTAVIKAKAHGATVKQKVVVKQNIFALKTIPTLYLGCPDYETVQINCKAHTDSDGDNWCEKTISSSNPAVVGVDEYGGLSVKSIGQATITVAAHGQKASQVVTVSKPWVVMGEISDMYYDGEGTSVRAWCGHCGKYSEDDVVYSSSDSSIIQVDKYGDLTPLKVGTATITARIHGVSASRTVSVKLTPYEISNKSMTLSLKRYDEYDDSSTLGVSCGICGSWCEKTTFRSSNSSVVEVDGDGYLYPKSKGTATITASAHGVSASCLVTVID